MQPAMLTEVEPHRCIGVRQMVVVSPIRARLPKVFIKSFRIHLHVRHGLFLQPGLSHRAFKSRYPLSERSTPIAQLGPAEHSSDRAPQKVRKNRPNQDAHGARPEPRRSAILSSWFLPSKPDRGFLAVHWRPFPGPLGGRQGVSRARAAVSPGQGTP